MVAQDLLQRYQQVRQQSLQACEPLFIEDFGLQAEAFTSPPKWHLAHTTWFFETFLLKPCLPRYRSPNEQYKQLFNSYYNGIGEQFSRPHRGLLSRPTVDEVMAYRAHVDTAMEKLLEDLSFDALIGVQGKDQFLGDDNALFTFVLRVKGAAGFESRCDKIRSEVGSFEGNAFRAVSTAARKGEFDSAAGEQLV